MKTCFFISLHVKTVFSELIYVVNSAGINEHMLQLNSDTVLRRYNNPNTILKIYVSRL